MNASALAPPHSETALLRPAGADLFRAACVGMVVWFHFWQQSWVSPGSLLEPLVRAGGLWVDYLLLLSAFCLFLPYAVDRVNGRTFRGTAGFWRRRAARLLPAYWLCVLVVFFAALLPDEGWTATTCLDLLAHLTLTQNWFAHSRLYTGLNGALWTMGTLAVFYLVFPLLARAVTARPLPTLAGMVLLQEAFVRGVCLRLGRDTVAFQMTFNSFPAFFGTFALGFGAALVYARLSTVEGSLHTALRLLAPAGAGATLFAIREMSAAAVCADSMSVWQVCQRMPWGMAGALLLLCLVLGPRPPLGALWAFLSGISYYFYLWHQQLALWLKYRWRIPAWTGEVPPNQCGDSAWSTRYLALCCLAAFGAAVLGTALEQAVRTRCGFLKKAWQKLLII